MKFISRTDLKSQYSYSTAKIKRRATLGKYGMSDRWYGGNAGSIVELEDDGISLVLDKSNKVIDVLQVENENDFIPVAKSQEIEPLPFEDIELEPDTQEEFNLDTMDKSELVIFAREKIGGRGYHSMTEENLRKRIKEELGM